MSVFRRAQNVDDELRHHVELMIEENEARGMSAAAARADALARFGDLQRIREDCEREDGMSERVTGRRDWVAGWRDDFRYALRVLMRSPAYVAVTVITLAFGIGAVASVFSALSPYFLRPLPFHDADRLVHVFTVDAEAGYDKDRFSLPQYEDIRASARGFTAMAAYDYTTANLSGDEAAEQVQLGRLSANGFDVLGARPAFGRTFAPGEAGRAGSDVLVLGWGLWQRRYAGDPSVIGRTIRVNGVPHTVIGVMGRDFNFPFGGVKAWTPIRADASTEPRDRTQFLVFGRLAPGWSAERAQADMQALWGSLAEDHPAIDGRKAGVNVMGLRPALNFAWDILRVGFTALLGAVLFVLLIACANITGLGLARAVSRRREVAVRAALGAPRRRLLRQFLVESAILTVPGAALGLLLAHALMRAAAPVIPEDLFAIGEFGVDGLVLAFTMAVAAFTALLVGITPALSVTDVSPADVLREGGRSGSGGRRTGRVRGGLVVTELALGLVLAAGAGLMARSLSRVSEVELGFEPEGLLAVELTVPANEYPDPATYGAFYDRVIETVAALPGVAGAATTMHLPLNHETAGIRFRVAGQPVPADRLPSAERFGASPGYFGVMGVRLAGGRDFVASDGEDAERVVVVNRALAYRHLGGVAAIGSTLLLGDDDARPFRVIGVVDDVRHSSIVSPAPPQVWLPIAQSPVRRRFLVVRANSDAAGTAASVRDAVTAIDADVPANRLRPMSAIVTESVGPFAAMSIVLGAFSVFALLLASIGLYGLIAHSVSRRGMEFGVRMALGAGPRELMHTVLRDGLRLAAIGIALGSIAALAAGRILASLLFGVGSGDPLSLTLAALVFLGTALLATAVPALRASRSDPLAALRAE